jgi:hypothetical protein
MLLAGLASADVPMHPALSIERLGAGNIPHRHRGSVAPPGGPVIDVDGLGRLAWAYVGAPRATLVRSVPAS